MAKVDFKEMKAKVIAKAWSDDGFRSELVDNPRSALASMGIETPEDTKIVFHEDTPDIVNFVIPNFPSERELSEDDLDSIAAGAGASSAPTW